MLAFQHVDADKIVGTGNEWNRGESGEETEMEEQYKHKEQQQVPDPMPIQKMMLFFKHSDCERV